jgi:hypothetical protein
MINETVRVTNDRLSSLESRLQSYKDYPDVKKLLFNSYERCLEELYATNDAISYSRHARWYLQYRGLANSERRKE